MSEWTALRENVREYRKTATVMAGKAPVAGIIPTLEGDHFYEAGDYICGPGAAGEFWPVKWAIFEATYAPVAAPPAAPSEDALEAAFTKAVNAPSASGRGIAVPHYRDVERIEAAIRAAAGDGGLDDD